MAREADALVEAEAGFECAAHGQVGHAPQLLDLIAGQAVWELDVMSNRRGSDSWSYSTFAPVSPMSHPLRVA